VKLKDESFVIEFGKNLRYLRISKGLSQENLANDANIPINQVGRIERGEINTTITTIRAIAQALQIPTSDLFDFE